MAPGEFECISFAHLKQLQLIVRFPCPKCGGRAQKSSLISETRTLYVHSWPAIPTVIALTGDSDERHGFSLSQGGNLGREGRDVKLRHRATITHFRFGIEHGWVGAGASISLCDFLFENGRVRHATDAITLPPDEHGQQHR